MSEEPKSVWKKSFTGPRWLGAWLIILTAATFVIILVITLFLPGGPHGLLEWAPASIALMGISLIIATALMCLWILLRWVINPKNFKRLLFALACFVTLIALIYAEEDFRGKWAWNNFKREWEAKGEKFDLASFIPPPVPDEQNFAMTPLFRPVLDYYRSTNGVRWNDTNGYARAERVHFRAADVKSDPSANLAVADKLTDFGPWRDYYRSSTNFPHPLQPGAAAQDVLVALGKFDAEMKELREAAATRPLSRFPIHYEETPPFGILLPHLARIKSLCQLFQLHALAQMELGHGEDALADIQVGFRLSDSLRDEPFLIDHLVRIAALAIDLNGVREGLARHVWDDAQLAQLEKYLAALDILAEYKINMRGERSFGLSGIEYYRQLGFRAQVGDLFYMGDDGGAQNLPAYVIALNFLPGGFYYQNMTAMARLHQEFTLAAVDEAKHRVFPDVCQAMTNSIAQLRMTPNNIFAKMLMPALARVPQKSSRLQTSVDEARVACALECYRLAKSSFPATLDLLAPQFLEKIPTDVIDGKPLRYRLNADGTYVLYSIGWNQTDDGGQVAMHKAPSSSIDYNQGDWVWTMPAK